MKDTVALATGNPGKIAELTQGLSRLGLTLRPHEPANTEETACTFVENALIKARAASAQTGLPAIADDSGLVVPALHGEPGIHSARFAGHTKDPAANIRKLLSLLEGMQKENRAAWFHCTLIWIAFPEDPAPLICEGQWHGTLTEPRGNRGFGYDPIFLDPASGKSAAELSPEAKLRVSHRGKALRALLKRLHPITREYRHACLDR